MTSTPQPGDILKLEPNDLFMVNKDLDGDGIHSETFAVKYENIIQDIKGDPGATGPVGSTGPRGKTGESGTSINILGVFPYYDKAVDPSAVNSLKSYEGTLTADNEISYGTVYIVEDDFSTDNTLRPGEDYIDSIGVGQRNVAYVYSPAAGSGGEDVFVRIGALTGADGPRGATGPYYDIIDTIDEPDQFRIVYKDSGHISSGPDYDATKYLAEDGLNYFAGLEPDTVEGDVRGATGPYYDEITVAVDSVETGTNADGDIIQLSKDYRLKFTSSTVSDPNNLLNDFTTINIAGPIGPSKGAIGDSGPTGPYYDLIEFEESGTITDTQGTYNTVVAKYNSSLVSDPNGVLIEYTSPNIRGPRGPAGNIDNLDQEIDNITNPPWVNKGNSCSDKVDEDVYGEKTLRNILHFNSCNTAVSSAEIVQFKNNNNTQFNMFLNSSLSAQGDNVKGLSLQADPNKTGIFMGFRRSDNYAKIGVNVVPYSDYSFDAKGTLAIQKIIIRDNKLAGKRVSDTTSEPVFKIDTQGIYSSRDLHVAGLNGVHHNVLMKHAVTFDSRFNGLRIMDQVWGAEHGHYYMCTHLNGMVVRRSTSRLALNARSSSENGVIAGNMLNNDDALNVIKKLKPRYITDEETTSLGFIKEDHDLDINTKLSDNVENNNGVEEASLQNAVAMLVASIQKLDERISALESN